MRVGRKDQLAGDILTLSGLVDAQAEARTDAPAIVDVDRTWSYGEVAEQRGRVSAALIASGIEPGMRVGVHFNKGADGFIAMHAIVSVGAIAVPLDPSSPPARLARICEQMQIEVVISHNPRRRSVTALHAIHPLKAVLGLDGDPDESSLPRCIGSDDLGQFDVLSPKTVSPDARSYIITTSGSTGEPKGIVHTHSSAMAYAEMAARTYAMTPQDRVSDIAPHHFDISTLSLWSVPLVGATNIVINEAYQRLPASHSQLLQDKAVTYWYSVPFLLQQLVTRGDLKNRDLSALRWVHFGGEVIARETIAEMMRHCPNARFANIFGPAETNQSSLAIFETPPPAVGSVSIGFPLDHTINRVIDPDANTPTQASEVGPGIKGELWTYTPQLMEGYWDQPERNAEVLKEVDGKCFYRTGDLVSVDDTGEFTFYGRVDHQVKVRGFRIELEGLELELEKLGFAEYVVVGILRAHSKEDELVAGLLGSKDDFHDADFLEAAASVLPSYAVPTRTVRIEDASVTGSGKLNRRVLREHAVAAVKGESTNERTS